MATAAVTETRSTMVMAAGAVRITTGGRDDCDKKCKEKLHFACDFR